MREEEREEVHLRCQKLITKKRNPHDPCTKGKRKGSPHSKLWGALIHRAGSSSENYVLLFRQASQKSYKPTKKNIQRARSKSRPVKNIF